ncbi:MAG: CapA family protein [Brevibacillus sp.]|nr:CapA family protein [Brevibacillus sp.]
MYKTRTDRLKAMRKQRQKRLFATLSGLLLFSAALAGTYMIWETHQQANRFGHVKEEQNHPSAADDLPQASDQPPVVVLTFVGDVMMDGNVEKRLKAEGYDYPYRHIGETFQQDDYTIANLETPVTKRGTPEADKQYVYKSPPEAIPAMKAAGIDLVNLANNHILDQGVEGLLDTMRVLDDNGIRYIGAGADANQAYAPVWVERNGISIAFFGFSRVVPKVSWYAGVNKPGVAASYDPARAVESIRSARHKADLIVVIAHWGKEKENFPAAHQKALARAYIDAGADLVVGGHPHVLQGFESYKKKWIAYSLGNFIFTRSTHPTTWETMILQASCTPKGSCQLRMLPYHAELAQAVPMNEQDGARLIKRIESLSVNVRIEPDGSVREAAEAQVSDSP